MVFADTDSTENSPDAPGTETLQKDSPADPNFVLGSQSNATQDLATQIDEEAEPDTADAKVHRQGKDHPEGLEGIQAEESTYLADC